MDNIIIRNMKEEDSSEVLEMMKVFYASPALLSDPSEDVMKRDIADCLGDNPFIECFVFENNTGVIMGYSMVAHSYSTECGGNCVWVEDIYIKPDYRGKSIAGVFFEHLDNMYGKKLSGSDLRLKRRMKGQLKHIRRLDLRSLVMCRWLRITNWSCYE